MNRAVRKVRMMEQLGYVRRPTRALPSTPVLTPEQVEAKFEQRGREVDEFIQRRGAAFDAYVLSVHPKIADRNARVAVEGDTDLNHDNVEDADV